MSVLVGQQAPNFTGAAVLPDNTITETFDLKAYLAGKKGLLFFYPLDFTFVCPSEILAFHNRSKEFEEKGTKIVGVSVDSQFTHLAWRNTPVEKGGIGQISFPLVADITKNIARDYDVLINEAVSLRGSFLIDEDFTVRHQVVNDLPLGRSVDEALRMVDALNFHQKNGEVCPANWRLGKEGMSPTSEGVASYLAKNASEL
jgi:peroxiredoxin (alkyl hydroperoxide reductase subunit C)